MLRLNQIIAIEDGEKTGSQKIMDDAYHALEKTALFEGMVRNYSPDTEEGETLPPEVTNVQKTYRDLLAGVINAKSKHFDVTATKEWGNTLTAVDVTIDDGMCIIEAVPVTYLLFLEKQLVNLHTFVSKIPEIDPAEQWRYDTSKGYYTSEPTQKIRTQKQKRVVTLAEATDKHPAQAQMYDDDVPVGKWSTVKFSGAISPTEKRSMLERIESMQRAVKFAREEANSIEVTDQKVASKIFEYIFG